MTDQPQKPTRVINITTDGQPDVYVGRPSRWGNPYIVGKHGTREEVIGMYREWLLQQPDLMARIHTLRGKTLGCWCKPAACHADVLAELADSGEYEPEESAEQGALL